MNYGRRLECNKGCGFKKSDLPSFDKFGVVPSGDWQCPQCNNLNYARRERCNRSGCNFEKAELGGGLGGSRRSSDDQDERGRWLCPRCDKINDGEVCAGELMGESCGLRKPDFDKFAVHPNRNQDTRRPGDWSCWRCGNINFQKRDACNKCQLSKEEAQDDSFR